MGYDIFGEILTPGSCEVHPHVSEPYPCSLCYETHGSGREQEQVDDRERPCGVDFYEYHLSNVTSDLSEALRLLLQHGPSGSSSHIDIEYGLRIIDELEEQIRKHKEGEG